MHFVRMYALLIALVGGLSGWGAEVEGVGKAPQIDKLKFEAYVRYAEGFSSAVKFAIDDPVVTPLQGYYRVLVHMSMGQTQQDKVYYVTSDGKHVLTGPVWDLDKNPFLETAAHVPTEGPSFGPANAKITLVVFSDFECPYCREFARTIRTDLAHNYKDVRVVFKDFPIESLHPWAKAASEAAHCVGDDNAEIFWSFHDWIFEHQGEIDSKNLREKSLQFSRDHGLDPAKVTACIDSHATSAEIESNIQIGRTLDITKTPTFFLDGRAIPGAIPWAALNTLLQMEENRPPSIPPLQSKK